MILKYCDLCQGKVLLQPNAAFSNLFDIHVTLFSDVWWVLIYVLLDFFFLNRQRWKCIILLSNSQPITVRGEATVIMIWMHKIRRGVWGRQAKATSESRQSPDRGSRVWSPPPFIVPAHVLMRLFPINKSLVRLQSERRASC
jgi:hypothetical protein